VRSPLGITGGHFFGMPAPNRAVGQKATCAAQQATSATANSGRLAKPSVSSPRLNIDSRQTNGLESQGYVTMVVSSELTWLCNGPTSENTHEIINLNHLHTDSHIDVDRYRLCRSL
jgi:hypothetical protein